LFQLSIIPFEIDLLTHYLLGLYALVWICLVTALVKTFDVAIHIAILQASFAGTSFLAGLGVSMVTYRLFFHRVRRFPGPLGAKISRFTVMSDVKKSGMKYHQELEKLHRQYGDFVRVGMYHLVSIFYR
jgi:hypothetical protein